LIKRNIFESPLVAKSLIKLCSNKDFAEMYADWKEPHAFVSRRRLFGVGYYSCIYVEEYGDIYENDAVGE